MGLIRSVSEGLGPVGGAAMIYTVSGLLCLVTVGFPDLRRFPGAIFLRAASCLSAMRCALSLGYAATRSQAIEVGMVNYLWPSLTIAFAILFNGQNPPCGSSPASHLAVGVCWVLGGENGLQLNDIMQNVVSSPLSYGLAFAGAFIWAAYCTVTSKYAKGQNGITLFVLLTALSLWVKYAVSDQPEMVFSVPVVVKLLMCGLRLALATPPGISVFFTVTSRCLRLSLISRPFFPPRWRLLC